MASAQAQSPVHFWDAGPTKLMTAEAWLDSVGNLTGLPISGCDPRFPSVQPRFVPPALLAPAGTVAGFNYTNAARLLGGCPDNVAQFRNTSASVLVTLEQRQIAAQLCGNPGAAAHLWPDGDPSAAALLTGLYRNALTREPADGEIDAVFSGAPAASAGVASNVCQALVRSGRFLFN
jgi:hypothetical protein